MRRSIVLSSVCAALLIGTTSLFAGSQDTPPKAGDNPKHTIKAAMTALHKKGLQKKVLGGKASKEDKLQLLEYYVALYENKPKKMVCGFITAQIGQYATGSELSSLSQQIST